MKTIIWDWNGTLLDDMDICIRSMNVLLAARKLELLTVERYKEVFTFPVIDYYKKLGFDFSSEPFDIPAQEFINEYDKNFGLASLQPGVIETLEFYKKAGIKQYILSAMEQKQLLQTVSFFGIEKYFNAIAGIDDHFAHSKVDRGIKLIKDEGLHPADILLAGDTLHDYETAKSLGCKCIFVANGHHPAEKLWATGAPVYKNLKELVLNVTI